MEFAGSIHHKTGGKIICCRVPCGHAHCEQERPELSRLGNRKSLEKSDDGCDSQRRSANKRRGNCVCQRIGFIRDSNASRRYTGSSISHKTLRRSRVHSPLDQWLKTTTHQKWQTDGMQHDELGTLRSSWSMDKLFKLIFTYISYTSITRSRNPYTVQAVNIGDQVGTHLHRFFCPVTQHQVRNLAPSWIRDMLDNFNGSLSPIEHCALVRGMIAPPVVPTRPDSDFGTIVWRAWQIIPAGCAVYHRWFLD